MSEIGSASAALSAAERTKLLAFLAVGVVILLGSTIAAFFV